MKLSRRNFIKLLSLLPLLAIDLPPSSIQSHLAPKEADSPNILILVFDTLSALHVSLYGYARETMPSLTTFAERATVYHSHYSAGNFTSPGTASLLTGTYPWSHRALSLRSTLREELFGKNIFSEFQELDYTQLAFSHNFLVNILMHNLRHHLDHYTLPNEIALADFNLLDDIFIKDYVTAARSGQVYFNKAGSTSASLFLSSIYRATKTLYTQKIEREYQDLYPYGLPGRHEMIYPLEETIDWASQALSSCAKPFLAYLHFMPPHDPYCPSKAFSELFNDKWKPTPKPNHHFSTGISEHRLRAYRRRYDQYIAYVDAEFGRFLDHLQHKGLLDNTWIIFTSDHGEMFERGIWNHTTRTLFQPILLVPLLISAPGQAARYDVYDNTSNVDLLPTLLQVLGQQIPDWVEGQVLPPYAEQPPAKNRSVFAVEAKSNPKFGPLTKTTIAMIKDQFKLVYYTGYEGFDGEFELFNLEEDPEELRNLYGIAGSTARTLTDEMLNKIEQVNDPFRI